MNAEETITLNNLGKLDFHNDFQHIATSEIRQICNKDDEYLEIYPPLNLTEDQALLRSKKYNVLQRLQVKEKSLLKKSMDRIDRWSYVHKIISTDYGHDSCIYFKNSRWLGIYAALVAIACIFFLMIPVAFMNGGDTPSYMSTIFTFNQNWLINTPMFFGFYNSSLGSGGYFFYSISRAYFWVNLLTRLLFIFFIIRKFVFSLSKFYSESYFALESSIGANVILGMWDFRAQTKMGMRFCKINLQDFIKKVSSTKASKNVTTSLNIIINIVCVGIIAASFERISWLISVDEIFFQNNHFEQASLEVHIRSPLIVSLVILSGTWLFDLLKCIEDYEKKYVTVIMSTGRILILNCGISVILLYHWSSLVSCVHFTPSKLNSTACILIRSHTFISQDSLLNTCWESWLGQRIFTYILVNVVVSFAFYFIVDIIKSIFKYSQKSFVKPKFFYSAFMGNLCYMDFLFWFGYYYSPVISVIWFLTVLLLFFYNINVISVSCFPSGSSSPFIMLQKVIFLLMFMISSLIGITALIVHSLIYHPSRHCGPFTNLDYNYSPETFNSTNYFMDNNFLKSVVDIGDQLLTSDGLWYSVIIFFLCLAVQFTFKVTALQKIYLLAQLDRKMARKDNRRAYENFEEYMNQLQIKRSSYIPSETPPKDSELNEKYKTFIL